MGTKFVYYELTKASCDLEVLFLTLQAMEIGTSFETMGLELSETLTIRTNSGSNCFRYVEVLLYLYNKNIDTV